MQDIPVSYEFRHGRPQKWGTKNPGILVVEGKYNFIWNGHSSGPHHFYKCKEYKTAGVKCSAKATVTINPPSAGRNPFPSVTKCDREHQCIVNIPRALVKDARYEMRQMIRQSTNEKMNPKFFKNVINNVRRTFLKKIESDEELKNSFLKELGTENALIAMLMRQKDNKKQFKQCLSNQDRCVQSFLTMESKNNENEIKENENLTQTSLEVEVQQKKSFSDNIVLLTTSKDTKSFITENFHMEDKDEKKYLENIDNFLEDLNLSNYLEIFISNKITIEVLLLLQGRDLNELFKEIKMPFGDRMRLRRGVEHLQTLQDSLFSASLWPPGGVANSSSHRFL